jgi:hypothetical protein
MSGACLISVAKDKKMCDTMSGCEGAMGLENFIQAAVQRDRAGSVILEHILCLDNNTMQGFQTVTLKEVVMTTC